MERETQEAPDHGQVWVSYFFSKSMLFVAAAAAKRIQQWPQPVFCNLMSNSLCYLTGSMIYLSPRERFVFCILYVVATTAE